MSIEKKSLIKTLHTTKKANVVKASGEISRTASQKAPIIRRALAAKADRKMLAKKAASKS